MIINKEKLNEEVNGLKNQLNQEKMKTEEPNGNLEESSDMSNKRK